MPDPLRRPRPGLDDELAEAMAGLFIIAATTAEEVVEDEQADQERAELFGPFMTAVEDRLAMDGDGSDPQDAEKDSFPTPPPPSSR